MKCPRWPTSCARTASPKGLFKNNFRFWRERRLARCEARGASARAPGASPPVGCDRRATKQMARRRPAPEGWGCLAVWRCCSLLTDRWRVCSSLAPSQKAKQPPAKSEFIFEQTLKPGTRGHGCPRSHLESALGKKSWHGTGCRVKEQERLKMPLFR